MNINDLLTVARKNGIDVGGESSLRNSMKEFSNIARIAVDELTKQEFTTEQAIEIFKSIVIANMKNGG